MYLSLRDLLAKVPVSKSSIYRAMKANAFPRPVRVGGRVLWVASEVDAWLELQR